MDLSEFQKLCEQAGCSRIGFELRRIGYELHPADDPEFGYGRLRIWFMANAKDGMACSLEEVAEQLKQHLEGK
jgi:hypothetical protein